MEQFTIAADGDEWEKRWWPQWTRAHFPSYEAFWLAHVVPLTYRVKHRPNIGFQTKAELEASGHTDKDVAVAQLHYTLLRHLGRVFELLDDARAFTDRGYVANRPFRQNEFFEAFARLSGASDVADELLARRATSGSYEAWNEDEPSVRDAEACGSPTAPREAAGGCVVCVPPARYAPSGRAARSGSAMARKPLAGELSQRLPHLSFELI
ncbi:MAG: hypothetical protein ACRDNP_09195 [Gaiellaceae bacterium]